MQRENQLKIWLDQQYQHRHFTLNFAAADADFRKYYRATFNDNTTLICMDAPPDKMNIAPYLKVQQLFSMMNVPDIYSYNENQGFVSLQDFGKISYLDALKHDTRDITQKTLLLEAIDELITLQKNSQENKLPNYDDAVMIREMQLFSDWYLPKELGKTLNFSQKKLWQQTIDTLLPVIRNQASVYVHRDYHVRNLMLTPTRPGVLDFQDALYGPITYDLVSLLRDAFIEWDEEFVLDLVIRYWEKAKLAKLPVPTHFDAFYKQFEWMGIQRHLKVVGIFSRLYHRDHKDKYRPEIPRFLKYLKKTSRRYVELAPLYALLIELIGDDELTMGFSF